MSLTVSAWCRGTHRTTGADQAVRIQILRDEIDVNEEYGLRSDASGLYRKLYGDWGDVVGSNTKDAQGNVVRGGGVGRLNADRNGYTVPDDAVAHLEEELEPLGGDS